MPFLFRCRLHASSLIIVQVITKQLELDVIAWVDERQITVAEKHENHLFHVSVISLQFHHSETYEKCKDIRKE